MSNTWIITTRAGEAAALAGMCTVAAGELSALAVGSHTVAEEAACVTGAVKYIDVADGQLPDAYAQAAAEALAGCGAAAVFGYDTPEARAIMGIFAAQSKASIVSNAINLSVDDSRANIEHTIIDGKVIETVAAALPACALAASATFQPVEPAGAPAAPIEQVAAQPQAFCELIQTTPIPDSGLETATYVIGVGRGVSNAEKFELAQQLAGTLGAQVSGTMVGVRDMGYFDEKADYIGLTGVRINPKLYIALGVSGATPHLTGIANANTVVCINNDENAPLFNHSNYGIVAPVEDVLPELINALQ